MTCNNWNCSFITPENDRYKHGPMCFWVLCNDVLCITMSHSRHRKKSCTACSHAQLPNMKSKYWCFCALLNIHFSAQSISQVWSLLAIQASATLRGSWNQTSYDFLFHAESPHHWESPHCIPLWRPAIQCHLSPCYQLCYTSPGSLKTGVHK